MIALASRESVSARKCCRVPSKKVVTLCAEDLRFPDCLILLDLWFSE